MKKTKNKTKNQQYSHNDNVGSALSCSVISNSTSPSVVQAIFPSGSQSRLPSSHQTLSPGRPKSTRGTCTASRSSSTSARRCAPRWARTAWRSPLRRLGTGGATRWASSWCCATPGCKVGSCHCPRCRIVPVVTGVWSRLSEDPVYLPAEEQREEYVRSDYGLVYMGSNLNPSGRPWSFGQVGGVLHMRAASGVTVCLS